MKRTRKGNDINILWEIFGEIDGVVSPYDLTGKDITLYLGTPFGKEKISNFSTEQNMVIWSFRGKDQKYLGVYRLILVVNEGENFMHTIDECDAFEIVAQTCIAEVECKDNLRISTQFNIGAITPDTELNPTSLNVVTNAAICEALASAKSDMNGELSKLKKDVDNELNTLKKDVDDEFETFNENTRQALSAQDALIKQNNNAQNALIAESIAAQNALIAESATAQNALIAEGLQDVTDKFTQESAKLDTSVKRQDKKIDDAVTELHEDLESAFNELNKEISDEFAKQNAEVAKVTEFDSRLAELSEELEHTSEVVLSHGPTLDRHTAELAELSAEVDGIDAQINGVQPKVTTESLPPHTGSAYENQYFSAIIPKGSIITSVTGCTNTVYLMKTTSGNTLGDNIYTASLPLTLDYDAYGIKAFAADAVTITYREPIEPTKGLVGEIKEIEDGVNGVINGKPYRLIAAEAKANAYAEIKFDEPIEIGSEIISVGFTPYGYVIYLTDEKGNMDTTNTLATIQSSLPFKTTKKYRGYATNFNGYFALGINGELGISNTRKSVFIKADMGEIEIYQQMMFAFWEKNVDVHFEQSTYTFTETMFSYARNYLAKEVTIGLPIGNGCRYYFNGSTLKIEANGEYTKVASVLDANKSASNYELHDAILVNNGGKYCVHDETYGLKGRYQHKYDNIRFVNNGGTMGLGLGTGYDGEYVFESCIFEPGQIIFHAPTNNADSSKVAIGIQLRNCVFKDTFFNIGTEYFNAERDDLSLFMVGCQMVGDIPSSTRAYFKEIIEYNNVNL